MTRTRAVYHETWRAALKIGPGGPIEEGTNPMLELERLARLAVRLVGASSGALHLSEYPGERPALTAMCGSALHRPTAGDFARQVAAAGRAAIGADRVGVPVISSIGEQLGALCVIGARVPYYDEGDLRALADLAVSAAREIELAERWAADEADVLDEIVDDDPGSEFLAHGTPLP
jgi:hypothetical protein